MVNVINPGSGNTKNSDDVFALLDVLSDPKKLKSRLDEFSKQAHEFKRLEADYLAVREGVEKHRRDSEKALEDNKKVLDEISHRQGELQLKIENKLKELADREEKIVNKEASIAIQETANRQKADELARAFTSRELSLAGRESEIAQKELKLNGLLDKNERLSYELEAKLASIRSLLS